MKEVEKWEEEGWSRVRGGWKGKRERERREEGERGRKG